MKKITQSDIENDYKEAIRNKYRSEKTEGEYSHYLNNPSQALLRDLCWEIFSSNPTADDLVVYRNFFKSEFNSKEENTSTKYTDKFRKVGAFLKGEKNPANLTTAELAAIFVDFEDRPFNKFKKSISIESGENGQNEKLTSTFLESEIKKGEVKEKNKIVIERENRPISFQSDFKHNFLEKLFNRSKLAMIFTAVIFCLIAATIYFAFTRNKCMQWTHDHYEKVDCDLSSDEFFINNGVEPYNENKFALKKIIVYDTTNCFKNGEAIVWYAKTSSDKADFFNTHGRHPENNKPLRPVTDYIKKRYGEKSVSKK
ncbi:hypothetical protein [Flavobacterium sp. MDT1-60]|uniref:hypothetical protein n=1 Tax=Flavobacterium sp. MDT1-60 TaxID=1979344 RepID=UPI00177CC1B6|nr:hypothetical protein [Flavobacterium sp. MDT1-60]QOG04286.1 hypothetical protein IHE43_08795 [Flavobacterium sp. MDT1-60]